MEKIRDALVQAIADHQVAVKPAIDAVPSPPSPLEPVLMETIRRDREGLLARGRGAADHVRGRHRRHAHAQRGHSHVWARRPGEPFDEPARAHGKDERVAVKPFYEGQEYLYRLVKALSGG